MSVKKVGKVSSAVPAVQCTILRWIAMRSPGNQFCALCSHLFEYPSGFPLGYSCSLSYTHAFFFWSHFYPWSHVICMSPRASFRALSVHLAKSVFPSGAPGVSPPCAFPKILPTFFLQSLSPLFPRTYFLCIFLSPLKTPPTDAIRICPRTLHHVSQKKHTTHVSCP